MTCAMLLSKLLRTARGITEGATVVDLMAPTASTGDNLLVEQTQLATTADPATTRTPQLTSSAAASSTRPVRR